RPPWPRPPPARGPGPPGHAGLDVAEGGELRAGNAARPAPVHQASPAPREDDVGDGGRLPVRKAVADQDRTAALGARAPQRGRLVVPVRRVIPEAALPGTGTEAVGPHVVHGRAR